MLMELDGIIAWNDAIISKYIMGYSMGFYTSVT
jgi:hypothetical protein